MPKNKRLLGILVSAFMAIQVPTLLAESQELVLHTFTFHKDGAFPFAGVSFDSKGNLYGVSSEAGFIQGSICCGTVFQLVPSDDGTWAYNVIHTFEGPISDGEDPTGSVIFDSAGNLYGTTQNGGWCGVVYELSPTPAGPWKETILHYFNNIENGVTDDGCIPSSSLVFDKAGNLYGTTQQTGLSDCQTNAGCGTVFELSPTGSGTWTEEIIHRFALPKQPSDGAEPYGGLALDRAGNLWGTTIAGGSAGLGTVFELEPQPAGKWSERIVFNFTDDTTGWEPYAGLALDASGNLYGTTSYGGVSGAGVVFKLTPRPGGQVAETLIHQFSGCNGVECPDGFYPFGGVAFDASGNLYGATTYGGGVGMVCTPPGSNVRVGCGVVYSLIPSTKGAWKYRIVHRFPGDAEGGYLTDDRLAVDSNGDIFGTTFVEGDVNSNSICPQAVEGLGGCGVVFKLTP